MINILRLLAAREDTLTTIPVISASGGYREITISWEGTPPPAGIDDIILEYSTDSFTFTELASYSGSPLELNSIVYTHTGLDDGQSYFYQLKFVKGSKITISNIDSATTFQEDTGTEEIMTIYPQMTASYKLFFNEYVRDNIDDVYNAAENAAYKSFIDGSSDYAADAFRYVKDNNVADGKAALNAAYAAIQNTRSTREVGDEVQKAAIVFCWCRDLFGQSGVTPTLLQFQQELYQCVVGNTIDSGDSPVRYREGDVYRSTTITDLYTDRSINSVIKGHNTEHIAAHVYVAIALYDYEPRIYQQVSEIMFTEWFPMLNWICNGAHPTGTRYGQFRNATMILAAHAYQQLAQEQGISVNSPLKKAVFRNGMFGFYMIRPDGAIIEWGDKYGYYPSSAYEYAFYHSIHASFVKDADLVDGYEKLYNSSNRTAMRVILELITKTFNRTPAPGNFADLPKSYTAPYPSIQGVFRTGWNIGQPTSDDFLVHFDGGQAYIGGHAHRSAGGFSIYCKGMLTGQRGLYRGSDFNNPHREMYYGQSIANNCILIYDHNQTFRYGSKVIDNSGGQTTDFTPHTNLAYLDYLRDHKGIDQFDSYRQLSMNSSDDFLEMKTDLTRAYTYRAERVHRHQIALGKVSSTGLGVVIIKDNIRSSDAGLHKILILNSIENPTISGNKITIRRTQSYGSSTPLYSSYVSDGKLECTVFGTDVDINKVSGYPTTRDQFGNVQSSPDRQPPNDLTWESAWQEDGNYRCEIRPVIERKEDTIIQVLVAGDKDNSLPQPTYSEDGGKIRIEVGDKLVMLSSSDQKVSQYSFTTSGIRDILLCDLQPGTYRINSTTVNVEAGKHSAMFINVPAGTYSVEKDADDDVLLTIDPGMTNTHKMGINSVVMSNLSSVYNHANNADKKSRIEASNSGIAKAFLYILNNDVNAGKEALNIGYGYANYRDTINKDGYLQQAAFIYNWCKELFGQAGVSPSKTQYYNRLYAAIFSNASSDPGDNPVIENGQVQPIDNMYSDYSIESVITGHNMSHWMTHLAIGMAIYDDEPRIYNQVAAILFNHIFPAHNTLCQKAHHQGTIYGSFNRANTVLTYSWLMNALAMDRGLTNIEPLSREFYEQIYHSTHTLRPDGKYAHWGDFPHEMPWSSSKYSHYIRFYAYTLRDGNLLDLGMQSFVQSNTNDQEAKTFEYIREILTEALRGNLTRGNYQDLSKGYISPYPNATGAIRNSWTLNRADGTDFLVVLQGASVFVNNHQHRNVGHYEIFYRGCLTRKNGMYQGSNPISDYSQEHWYKYYNNTVSHNCPLIYDHSETQRFGAKVEDNTGGQFGDASDGKEQPQYLLNVMNDNTRNRCDLLSSDFNAGQRITLKNDITGAYKSYKLSKLHRTQIAVVSDHPLIGGILIVRDSIITKNTNYKKIILNQSHQDPTLSGNKITLRRTGTSVPSASGNYDGKADIHVFGEDVTLRKISGFVTTRNSSGIPQSSPSYDPGNKQSWQIAYQEKDAYRAEIHPDVAKLEHNIIQVIVCGDEDDTLPVPTYTENSDVITIDIGDKFFVLSKTGNRKAGYSFTTSGVRDIYVHDLNSGNYTLNSVTQEATDENQSLYWENVPAGTYNI